VVLPRMFAVVRASCRQIVVSLRWRVGPMVVCWGQTYGLESPEISLRDCL